MSIQKGFKAPITAAAADAQGHPTGDAFDAPPVWALSDSSLASLDVAVDGLSAVLTPSGIKGTVVVSAEGDVAGISVSGSLPVDVGPAPATQILLTLGTPVPA